MSTILTTDQVHRTILHTVSLGLLLAVLVYGLFVWSQWQLNPGQWPTDIRVLSGILIFGALGGGSALGATLSIEYYKQK